MLISAILGITLGVLYIIFAFYGRKEGEPPRCNFTCGPFKEGMIIIHQYHIHHWMVFGALTILFGILCSVSADIFIGFYIFSAMLTLHGLMAYSDAFNFVDDSSDLHSVERL